MKKLKERIKNACLEFLDSIEILKLPFRDENKLIFCLSIFNQNYLRLMNLINYKVKSVNLYSESKTNELEKFRCNKTGFSVIISERYGIISAYTGHSYLNSKVLEINKYSSNVMKELTNFLSLYVDYNKRRCDKCLKIRNDKFWYALERIVEEDYVSAYHTECLPNNA